MRILELEAAPKVDSTLFRCGVSVGRPQVARFAVASDVPPRITEALSLGEQIHRALVSHSGPAVFLVCVSSRQPLSAGHQHAFSLSECDMERGGVKFVTLHAPMGFDDDARRALEQLRQT